MDAESGFADEVFVVGLDFEVEDEVTAWEGGSCGEGGWAVLGLDGFAGFDVCSGDEVAAVEGVEGVV